MYFLFMRNTIHSWFIDKDEQTMNGGLAQLARAFDWQSKGRRFESAYLHKIGIYLTVFTTLPIIALAFDYRIKR